MITEKCILPIGVEYDGKVHCHVELRPSLVRDSIEAVEDERAQTNESYLGLTILSKQIVCLGTIPADKITPNLLMGMYEPDLVAIRNASERLRNRLYSFRGTGEGSAEIDAGDGKDGLPA